MKERISVNDILTRVQAAAKQNGVSLTYTNNRVYLQLLEYVKDNSGIVIHDVKGIRFHVTTHELAQYCSVSPRIITESLRKFNKCGIIKYTTNRPNPSVVLLYKQFFE